MAESPPTFLCPAAVWVTTHAVHSMKSHHSCNYYWQTSSLIHQCGWLPCKQTHPSPRWGLQRFFGHQVTWRILWPWSVKITGVLFQLTCFVFDLEPHKDQQVDWWKGWRPLLNSKHRRLTGNVRTKENKGVYFVSFISWTCWLCCLPEWFYILYALSCNVRLQFAKSF